jgi:Ran GTPase-activating protein (RanGAP) involved in mRNA processing and transport
MFAISQLILTNTNFIKNNLQSYSIIIGLVLYASVYLYLLYTNHHYLTFYNNFIVYIVLVDLLIAGFMYYKKASRNDKLDILNTDLVNFLNTKDDYENIDDDENMEDDEESEADEDEDEHEDEESDHEEHEDEILEQNNNQNKDNIQNDTVDANEQINLPNMNLKDMFSNITQLNFGNIDFNKMQQDLVQSGILESNTESKIQEIIEPLETTEIQNEMTEASDLIDIPAKKKRGRKPKIVTEQQTKAGSSKIQISK